MRYFANKLQDFEPGSRVNIDVAKWKKCILEVAEAIVQKMPPTFESCDGGLYVGCSGVAYMFYYLAKADHFADVRQELLTKARNYLDVSLSYARSKRNKDPPAAFLLGNAGVYAVGSLIYDDIGEKKTASELNKKYLSLSTVCQPIDFLQQGSDELFVGRAGYLCGALLLNRHFGNRQVVPTEPLYKVWQALIQSGKLYSRRNKSNSPLMYAYYGTEYLGAAHGLSAILQMLLCFPDFLQREPEVDQEVKTSVDFMLSLMQPNGNIPPAMDEVLCRHRPDSEELVHWCHGAPGIVYLFAKAFLHWKEEKYLQACLKCGEITWQKGLLKKGPGICHGVAGSGYVFLLLYRLTSDEKHLHRALKFGEFMFTGEFQRAARTPDCPYSLYEGLAGSLCFLADLLQPLKAEFPFFDVYY